MSGITKVGRIAQPELAVGSLTRQGTWSWTASSTLQAKSILRRSWATYISSSWWG